MGKLNIYAERIKRGWTLEHVGQQVGVRKSAIHNIEVGYAKPSYDVLIKLCKLYEIPHAEVERLFTEAAESDNSPSP